MKMLRRYEFSERLAEILGASRRDLRVRVTLMVTEGLAPPGPRGPGAPPATPDYAADFLIGVMAAPQQVHTVEAIRCYRELRPTSMAAEATAPGVSVGTPGAGSTAAQSADLALPLAQLRFGEALTRLLDQARDTQTRATLARQLFGVWISRGFPVAAVQLAAWSQGRRAVITQRYELAEGRSPPAWLDPARGGLADPGLFHSVFLPAGKLLEIGSLTAYPDEERKSRMINLDQTITNLADLARNRRHRPAWNKFLAAARKARAWAEKVDAKPSRLAEVGDFGTNPGNLKMLTYVPPGLLESAPLVVVFHGCTQTAHCYDYGTGWLTLADRHGFALLLPEQRRTNNPLRCFNWFRPEDLEREGGEPQSVRQMIEWMAAKHGIDRRRVYVTGVSAGGAMTSVMLATHPELFAGGAIIAGLPYRCANGLQEGFECIFQGRSKSAPEWGSLIRGASAHDGRWPKISVWHGAADSTVKPTNAEEIIKQWANVHGIAPDPTIQTAVAGHPYRIWQNADGEDVLEAYTITGMGHGVPIDPNGEGGCGTAGPFILDVGIWSTHHIARFWGLTELRAAAGDADRPVELTLTPQREDTSDPGAEARGADGAVPPGAPPEVEAEHAAGGTTAGADLQKIIAKALNAAGLGGGDKGTGSSGRASGMLPIVDLPKILSTSFEAAGLLKGRRDAPSAAAGGQDSEAGASRGIDIAAILAKSFEAAGLLKGRLDVPTGTTDEANGLAAAGWRGQGWRIGNDAPPRAGVGPVLFGHATSGGKGAVGKTVRSIERQFSLGQRPTLSYARKLDLNAAVNLLTAATFRVLVDGVVVDEVSDVGMNYEEPEWTERNDIDISCFAGRTVTLTFEVAAHSNVFVEVFAKAWVAGITIHDDTRPGQG